MTTPSEERTLGELVATASRDLSTLIHKEVELAKAELRAEAMRAGKSAGLLGASAALGLPAMLLLTTAAALAIATAGLDYWVGFVCIGGFLALMALGLAGLGVKKMTAVRPPERTIRTVRDDLEWARHPTVAPQPEAMRLRSGEMP